MWRLLLSAPPYNRSPKIFELLNNLRIKNVFLGCIFCSRNKNLVCVKCDKVVGKVSKEKVKNIKEECEKSKVVARKQRKAKKRKQKLPPNKEKKKLIRKVSQKKRTNLEGEVRRRSKMNVENPR